MTKGQAFEFLDPTWFDELGSTSTHLRQMLKTDPLPSGTVVAARTQTSGRGRMGNAWHSPPRGDLTFSFLWTGKKPRAELAGLSMAVALGVGDWLDGLGVKTFCKWPNDVMTGKGKICGIIAEASFTGDSVSVVMGVGVNVVASSNRSAKIRQPIASIEEETGASAGDPGRLLPALLRSIAPRMADWERDGFSALRKDLSERLWGVGKRVEVREGNRTRRGRIVGLSASGGLVLEENGGEFGIVSGVVGLEPEAGDAR
ncbi:MAG: biotin--[acetyl-CoA-carboxylase] ligase [Planctomycetota bacterium]|jgi:BirA family biotin operon repressor/biotin-[acetyl-CoA-carboxylase] ligase|nr:biotin--[acetyl-CoA-carboxylase] ligase [Planctomycetota bacterium]